MLDAATGLDRSDLPERIAAFRRDGYVHVPRVFTPDQAAHNLAAVDRAVLSRKANDPRTLAERTPYEQSFIQCEYLWEDFPEVAEIAFHPKLAGLAAALLGAPSVRMWHDQALYKEAGGRETDAHQDHAYWPIVELDAVTAWAPLVDVDQATGCMGYVAGSQAGDCDYVDIFGAPGSGKALEAKHRDNPPRFTPAKAGDVIFHAARTVHMAGPNRTDRTRRVYTSIYFRDGCTRSATPKRHPSVDRDAIGVGEPIAGGATPIAWPLPGGRRPAPAPWPALDDRSYRWAVRMGVLPPNRQG
jgi:ectoine hydroxylase-related dioxygenase (phytanoyl-CoA dioxygenase family)